MKAWWIVGEKKSKTLLTTCQHCQIIIQENVRLAQLEASSKLCVSPTFHHPILTYSITDKAKELRLREKPCGWTAAFLNTTRFEKEALRYTL